jgi:heavy metal sensor kinase
LKNVSLPLRLTFRFCAIFLCGFLLFGVAMWIDLAYSLSKGRDRTLMRRATRFIDLLHETSSDPPSIREARFQQLADVIPEGNLIQVFSPDGKRIYPKIQAPDLDFPWPAISTATTERYADFSWHGRPFRLFTLPVNSTPPYVVLVGGQLEDNHNMMARFTMGLAWAIPAMLVLSAFGGFFLSRRVLQPVDEITAAVRQISIGNLSQRLPISETADELQRLAETCNDMLQRLEDAVSRIRRFTADASHELRSPVALMRAVAEYALRNPGIDGESKEAFGEILAESVEAGQLLEDMLTLARADAGHPQAIFESMELTGLVEDVCARLRPLAEAKHQEIVARAYGGVWISGDRSSLRRLLSILLDNAIKYTPAHGRIEVDLKKEPEQAILSVKDSGIGIPADVLPRIFDRFVRADPSRGEVNGTGLGLAIAKWIAGIHNAALTAESKEREGSVFRVAFQLAEPPRDDMAPDAA